MKQNFSSDQFVLSGNGFEKEWYKIRTKTHCVMVQEVRLTIGKDFFLKNFKNKEGWTTITSPIWTCLSDVYFFRYNDFNVNVLISITRELLNIKLWNWDYIFSRPRHIIHDRKISSNKSRDKFVIDHVRFSIF